MNKLKRTLAILLCLVTAFGAFSACAKKPDNEENKDAKLIGKEPTEFPESYKLLLPESKVSGYGEFNFVTGDDIEDSVMQYDVFIYAQNRTPAPQNVEIWLYKDLTAYYQNKYPEANVKAVVIRYMVKNL